MKIIRDERKTDTSITTDRYHRWLPGDSDQRNASAQGATTSIV